MIKENVIWYQTNTKFTCRRFEMTRLKALWERKSTIDRHWFKWTPFLTRDPLVMHNPMSILKNQSTINSIWSREHSCYLFKWYCMYFMYIHFDICLFLVIPFQILLIFGVLLVFRLFSNFNISFLGRGHI